MPAHILLIEDNPANLELMSYLLKAFGYSPLAAKDGPEGLAAAHSESPDLIICDVQLPTLDGYEVARRLKADPKLCTVPVVAVTALAMVGDRERVLAAGFDGYLAKPINPETFVGQVEAYLPPDCHATVHVHRAASTAVLSKPLSGRTILVVDNLPVNLHLARSILEPRGYKVLTAGGPTEGLTKARKASCDLILSDVCMSGELGYDFIQEVRADPQLRAIPFVFITSTMLDENDRAKGLALGATKFLFRPIEP
jgi:two-component system cell cycle response regulator